MEARTLIVKLNCPGHVVFGLREAVAVAWPDSTRFLFLESRPSLGLMDVVMNWRVMGVVVVNE